MSVPTTTTESHYHCHNFPAVMVGFSNCKSKLYLAIFRYFFSANWSQWWKQGRKHPHHKHLLEEKFSSLKFKRLWKCCIYVSHRWSGRLQHLDIMQFTCMIPGQCDRVIKSWKCTCGCQVFPTNSKLEKQMKDFYLFVPAPSFLL